MKTKEYIQKLEGFNTFLINKLIKSDLPITSIVRFQSELSQFKSEMEAEKEPPEHNFRKDIAEELSRGQLIDRLCEMNQDYQKLRKDWFEMTLDKVKEVDFVKEFRDQFSEEVKPKMSAEEILNKITGKTTVYLRQNFLTIDQSLQAIHDFHNQYEGENKIKLPTVDEYAKALLEMHSPIIGLTFEMMKDEAEIELNWLKRYFASQSEIKEKPVSDGCNCAMPTPDADRECCMICGKLLHSN